MRQDCLVAKISDEEVLRRFVVRARRVKAHSLAKDLDRLARDAAGGFEVSLDLAGRSSITRTLPDDEEAFESFASRIRPLTVKQEPIYYTRTLDAIEHLSHDVDDNHRARLDELRKAWEGTEIQGVQVQGYAVQQTQADGSGATGMVSDTQLAAGWLYADLVHADPTGPKTASLDFSLKERYAAAVRVFSRMAMLTIWTLQLVEALRNADSLVVDETAWTDPVVVEVSEITEQAHVFMAPVGAQEPDLRESLEWPAEWSPVTVTAMLRQDSANHVRVVLRNEAGSTIVSYDAAVARRGKDGISNTWDVLVADSVLFKFAFERRDESTLDGKYLGLDVSDSNNALKLAATRLMLRLDESATVAFEVSGHELVRLGSVVTFTEKERHDAEIVAQTVEDILVVERLTGREIGPCTERLYEAQCVQLRRVRLMLEGHVVLGPRGSVTVTSSNGRPPQLVVVSATMLDVGGSRVPVPVFLMRHPHMTQTEVGDAREVGAEAKTYTIEPPDGERFLAWMPDKTSVSEDSDLVATATWGLIGIDESTLTG